MNEIDLHGFTHIKAIESAEDFVLKESQKDYFSCKIITGNSTEMIKKIIKMLESHDFNFYIPSWNMGYIIVTS